MNVSELKELCIKLEAEGKGHYNVTSFNGDYNFASWRYDDTNSIADVEVIDDMKRLDISVGD